LVRHAWAFPSIDSANFFYAVARQPAWQNYDFRCSNRVVKAEWLFQYDQYLAPLRAYDLLFDYIRTNQLLAGSLHRFIPSIHSPADVTAFLDAYLVQHLAKRTLRGFDHTWPSAVATIAAAVGQPQLSDDWVKPYADNLLPFLYSDTDSHGCKQLGSTFYSHGEGAREHGVSLEQYIRAGGSSELSLLARTPRPLNQCEWALDIMTAGWDWLRIGDVTGPNGNFTHARGWAIEAAEPGWRWGRDARFAWVLQHVRGRKQESHEEWQAIERAAAAQPRAPWLDNRSRVVANWAAVLETGWEHDDPRFRRSAWLRVGIGSGHAHSDLLDLHVHHAGLQAMIEGGQRSGYSKPNDKLLRVHNTVEVLDGQSAALDEPNPPSHATGLVDATGSRTLEALAAPTKNASLYRRRIALIDVDEGTGSQPLTPRQQALTDDLPRRISPGNSYLVDIFRVAGGAMHSYAIHGTVNDDFQWNALEVQPVEHIKPTTSFTSEAAYLSIFEQTPGSKAAGDAPDTFEATWRMVRFEKDTRGGVSEEALLGRSLDPASPRRFTKLRLLGAQGLRVLKADVLQTKCAEAENIQKNWTPPLAGYRWTCVYARTPAQPQPQSAFVGIIEPYLGEPYIASAKLIDIADNERDALRAVALEVKLKNGRTDFVFADGRFDRVRQMGARKARGEYGFLSTDGAGFRQATLAGGTLLQGPEITLALAQAYYRGKVDQLNLTNQTAGLDAAWPCLLPAQTLAITGSNHALNLTLAKPDERMVGGSRLAFTRDAILSMDPAARTLKSHVQIGDTIAAPCFVNIWRAPQGGWLVEGNADAVVALANQPVRRISAGQFAQFGGRLVLRPDGSLGAVAISPAPPF